MQAGRGGWTVAGWPRRRGRPPWCPGCCGFSTWSPEATHRHSCRFCGVS